MPRLDPETQNADAPVIGQVLETDLPSRLDRLPWSKWHWLVITALGITWVLDGLEVTLAGSVGAVLTRRDTLGLSAAQVGGGATAYLAGAVLGAIIFGYATDRLGRKKLFTFTLLVYLCATALTAASWNFASYVVFRALTGAGIGGEYAAINSAIDELIPARVRGRVDLIINSSFWIGAAIGAAGTIVLLDLRLISLDLAWRLTFGIGAVLGLGVLVLRHWVPESPRWLVVHGRRKEADKIVSDIENEIGADKSSTDSAGPSFRPNVLQMPLHSHVTRIKTRSHTSLREIWDNIIRQYRVRSLLGLTLMVAQAFFYNAIFFTYALVLSAFYGVPDRRVGVYLFPFALGNFAGPLVLGHLFDVVGRKVMISATYATSGILLAITGLLFERGVLTARTQAIAWTVIFFVASAAASSAYLTVSEVFPLEIRAFAIAIFYAVGTLVGGVGAPLLFGYLIESHSRTMLFYGYLLGAALMVVAAVVEILFGVAAERKSLEDISTPLSSHI